MSFSVKKHSSMHVSQLSTVSDRDGHSRIVLSKALTSSYKVRVIANIAAC